MHSCCCNEAPREGWWRRFWPTLARHFWFKCIGTSAFITVFFWAYIYLLKNPAGAVTTMPLTALDRLIPFTPLALLPYLSLWFYVSLPPILMVRRRAIVIYGVFIGAVCLIGLGVFMLWPSAVPPADIDWARYPGMDFLKGIDAAGNACPSLHVATAVFSAVCLARALKDFGTPLWAGAASWVWCLAIVYSTVATRQHVVLDVLAGGLLGAAGGLLTLRLVGDQLWHKACAKNHLAQAAQK